MITTCEKKVWQNFQLVQKVFHGGQNLSQFVKRISNFPNGTKCATVSPFWGKLSIAMYCTCTRISRSFSRTMRGPRSSECTHLLFVCRIPQCLGHSLTLSNRVGLVDGVPHPLDAVTLLNVQQAGNKAFLCQLKSKQEMYQHFNELRWTKYYQLKHTAGYSLDGLFA